jgi:transposase, IS6 family
MNMTIELPTLFKWRHFQGEIIVFCTRWYLRYGLSYRDLEEMMAERGLKVDHSTIARWVLAYAPELEKRVKPLLKPTNDSWKVDETYIKVKGEWLYQYRAVDSDGQTIEFFFSAKRDAVAAQAFFEKALGAPHTVMPRVINVDKNAAYPRAVDTLKAHDQLPPECALRQVKYLNNLIEQDHRFIKRRTRPGLGFFSFETARRTLAGYETMHMIRKGQVKGAKKGDILAQVYLINRLFGIVA